MDPAVVIAGLLALVGSTWTALIAGFFRGDLIPGHVYRREVKRADTATTQAERNASSIADLAKAHAAELVEHTRDLAAKDQSISDLHKRLADASAR